MRSRRARSDQIVAWARRTGCVIVEDDCGADFRYEGAAAPALAAAAPDCAIHLGTFSQSLGAGLRLGYMVVPPAPGRRGAGGQGVAEQWQPVAGASRHGGVRPQRQLRVARPAHAHGLSRTARPPADRAGPPFRRGRDQRRRRRPASVLALAGRRARCRDGRGPGSPGARRGVFAAVRQRVRSIGGGAVAARHHARLRRPDAEADRARDRAPIGRGGRCAGWAPHRVRRPAGLAAERVAAHHPGPSAGGAANRLHGFARNRLSRRRRRAGQIRARRRREESARRCQRSPDFTGIRSRA